MASTIPSEGRVLWSKTHAGIPANWSRDTDFDGKYLQGDPTAGSDAGVAHAHGGNNHDHIADAHSHNAPAAPTGAASGSSDNLHISLAGGTLTGNLNHTHGTVPTDSVVYTLQNAFRALQSTTAEPPTIRTIVIKPDDGLQDVPIDGIVFADTKSQSANFKITDGTASTTDLNDQFVQAPTTGADGGTTTGSATHTHVVVDHDHTANSHTHADVLLAVSSAESLVDRGAITTQGGSAHHTATSFSGVVASISTNTTVAPSAESSEPVFTQLLGLQNKGGGAETPNRIIIPFTGTTVPDDWIVCDGTNGTLDLRASQIKVTAFRSSIGVTGGVNSHTHTEPGHGHTENILHFHTFSISTATRRLEAGTDAFFRDENHTHTGMSQTSDDVATINDATMVWDSFDKRAPYRTVKWIKKGNPPTVIIKGANIKGGAIAA